MSYIEKRTDNRTEKKTKRQTMVTNSTKSNYELVDTTMLPKLNSGNQSYLKIHFILWTMDQSRLGSVSIHNCDKGLQNSKKSVILCIYCYYMYDRNIRYPITS